MACFNAFRGSKIYIVLFSSLEKRRRSAVKALFATCTNFHEVDVSVCFFFSDNVNVNLHFLAERFLREPTPTGWLLADRTSVSYWIGCIRYSGFVWVALVQGMHFMISVIDCDRVKCVVTKIYLRNPDILERTFLLNNAFSCLKFKSNMRSFITLQLLICPNYVYIYLWSKFFRSIKRCLYKFQYRYPPNLFKNHYKILIFYIVSNIV